MQIGSTENDYNIRQNIGLTFNKKFNDFIKCKVLSA